MIVFCPSCATRQDLPPTARRGDSGMTRCTACGHSWLESRAVDVIDLSAQPAAPPVAADLPRFGFEPDREVRRLVEASMTAATEFALKRAQRQRRMLRWGVFAAAVVLPITAAAAFPEAVVRQAPAAAKLYNAIGLDVNIYGLEIRKVEQQHMTLETGRVLAVKGLIFNVTDGDKKVPALRFGLLDEAGKEVYSWTVDSGVRPLRPGEATNFVTRVAAPPESALTLQIRFARREEIGSTAAP